MSIPGLNSVGVEPWSKLSERDVSQERRGCEWKQEKKDATLHRGWNKGDPDTPIERSLRNLGQPPTSGAPWRTQTCPSLAWTLWGLNPKAKFQKGMLVKEKGMSGLQLNVNIYLSNFFWANSVFTGFHFGTLQFVSHTTFYPLEKWFAMMQRCLMQWCMMQWCMIQLCMMQWCMMQWCASQWTHATSQGEMPLIQLFLDQFWIFLVQINAKGSHFVPCASQWNHTTSQWENGHNSAMSWPILDLFGTYEHQRNPFCPMCFSMESLNLSVRKWP